MNSVYLVMAAGFVFVIGYIFYGKKIDKLLKIDPKRKTPSYRMYDGVDYVPAKHWSILFGHHFASIAGAAPIIGPVLAVSIWGWAPALLWVVLGSVLIGGIHDYSSLVMSIRDDGTSIADIAKDTISKNAKLILTVDKYFVLLVQSLLTQNLKQKYMY